MGKNKDKKHKKKHKERKEKRRQKSTSSSSSEEWVEKEPSNRSTKEKVPIEDHSSSKSDNEPLGEYERDEWMKLPTNYSSYSNLDRRAERDKRKQLDRLQQIYDPSTCSRELNPYWKGGGDGLPKFKRPVDYDGDGKSTFSSSKSVSQSQAWRKRETKITLKNVTKSETTTQNDSITKVDDSTTKIDDEVLLNTDLNMLASKLVKAEIMGNTKLVEELKNKLEKLRHLKVNQKTTAEEDAILTYTDAKGDTRPVRQDSVALSIPSGSKAKKQKVETHEDRQRVRYFADDDKYSLKEMFEREKYVSSHEQNKDFMQMASKIHRNDDLDEVFVDKVRYRSDSKTESKVRDKAVNDHEKISRSLDNCNKCLQSDNMLKHLMISMGETVYLSVPSHEPLTEGHCLLIPVRHVPCATQLDENEWQELMEFRKAITKMFNSANQMVIFFETAMYLHRFPHMSIECVPVPHEQGDLAPIYFKKAIDESEFEWSQNKKLIDLKGRNVQKAIPKGLPYFSISFGMEEGYAHVIEEEKYFPQNFAQEIIGGMLDLDHSKWRKPRRQNFDDQSKRVVSFSKSWSNFDITDN